MRARLLSILFIVQCIYSCKPVDEPVPVPGADSSAFYFSAYINGEYLSLKTDTSILFMNTGYEYMADSGCYRFFGNIAPEGCNSCPNSIAVSMYDSHAVPRDSSSTINKFLAANTSYGFYELNNARLGKVAIEYRDRAGNLFSNTATTQDGNFYVVSVEDYLLNKDHKRTKKIKARFDCVLQSTTTLKKLHVDNAEVVFSIAYPD